MGVCLIYSSTNQCDFHVPEDRIKIFVLYLSLRGGINTGKFEWSVEEEKKNAFPTFEKHLRKILEWKQDPKKFIKELLDNPKDAYQE